MENILQTIFEKVLQKRREILQHRKCVLKTESLLKSIESENGKINPKFKKLSIEYAQDVFGNKYYAPWLNVYAAIAGQFKEGWIPENYFHAVIIPKTQGLYGKISFANSLSNRILNTTQLPETVFFVNGLYFSPEWEVLCPDDVKNYIFKNRHKVVYKQDNSNCGRGVYIFTKETFDTEKIYKLGNGVFQNYIKQHPVFEEIIPCNVATIRITSVIEQNGRASCRAVFVRFGRKDETHCNWATDIKVPADLKTGKLNGKGYEALNFKSTNCHPDSKVAFEGKIIPNFDECIKYVIKTHQSIPFCRVVGWDIAVNENDEIQLMEWNGYFNDIVFSEATQGPCFADMGWENLWKK